MRLTGSLALALVVIAALIGPPPAHAAASKEMQDLQRDIAMLQDKLQEIQKQMDAKLTAIQNLAQQSNDTATKTSAGMGTLSNGLTQTMQTELKSVNDRLGTVTSLSVKVENEQNDISDLRSQVSQLVVTVNKQQALLGEILNQVKLIQAAPPAAPPSDVGAPGAPPAAVAPPPMPATLFNTGVSDMNAGKSELALSEFSKFLELYPNDPNAKSVQLNIGEIHYGQPGKLDQSVTDFDAVIERYSEDQLITPDAYYMKGQALEKLKRPADAKATYRAVVQKFPHSDQAKQAQARLTALGGSTVAKAPASRRQQK